MSAPHTDVVLDPAQALDGMAETARRLISDFGLTVRFAKLASDVGTYDGTTREVLVDSESPLGDQLYFLIDVWRLCAIGPSATDLEVVEPAVPALRVVPEPRH